MGICAYCGTDAALTREHLWPASLHKRLMDVMEEKHNVFWLRKIKKEISSEPTIRDVCGRCNNIVLSVLDGYMCQLFDRSFVHIPKRHERVEFEYDYHRLKRWLLKMCFNSARIHSSMDIIAFPPLLPYIRGESDSIGRSVQLFVQLSYPAEIPEEFLEPDDPSPSIYYPTTHRMGNAWFAPQDVGRKLLRAVHLRAFSFYLAFWQPNEPQAAIEFFTKTFLEVVPATVLLRASRAKETLICDGMNAWDSISDSRDIEFEWTSKTPRT
jgi:hypothetical protein